MSRHAFVTAAITVFLLGAPRGAHAAAIISVGPYVPGPVFSVPIEVSGVDDLVTWQFDLAFDPAVVQATLVTEGPFTSRNGVNLTLFIPGVIDNTAGLISLVAGAYLDIPPGPSGSGVLAYVDFTTIGTGSVGLSVANPIIEGNPVVPEPTTLTLLALGVALRATTVRARLRGQRVGG